MRANKVSKPEAKTRLSPTTLLALLSSAALTGALAIYQWVELIAVRGGATAVCSLNETVDCSAVWNSAFAGRMHDYTGVPVAGLGLEWSLVAAVLSGLLWYRNAKGRDVAKTADAVKAWGIVGFLSSVMFAAASARLGALCLTCLGTYVLVGAFALVALFRLPPPHLPPMPQLARGLLLGAAVVVPVHLALLYPGQHTPKSTATAIATGPDEQQVLRYFASLTPSEKRATAEARAAWLKAEALDASRYPVRARQGRAEAKVRLVEFTDILCPHCRALVHTLDELRRAAPAGAFSVEARYFPLDSACNPALTPMPDAPQNPSSVRCVGAKAQICLEGAPDSFALREKLFDAQDGLTVETILSIASSGSVPRAKLEQCIADEATAKKLSDDISYAMMYRPEGTPLLLLNGKETYPVAPFLFGMVLSGADANAKYFSAQP